MGMPSKRVTVWDLARETGLSTTTVSDALAGRGRVSAKTREKVHAAADRIGYVPSSVARSLRQGRSGAIGLYLPDQTIGLDYYLQLCRGAAERALNAGFALTLVPAWNNADLLTALHLDALLVSDPSTDDPLMDTIRRLPIPVVTCEHDLSADANPAAVIEIDHRRGVTDLLEHLRERGARRVEAFVPPQNTGFGKELHRWFGACDNLDVNIRSVPFVTQPEALVDDVVDALRSRPDAIVTAPDGSAKLALDVVVEQRVSVPQELMLAGYTDASTHTLSRPGITAVDLQPRLTGHRAVEAALAALAGEEPPEFPPIEAHLRPRTTTG